TGRPVARPSRASRTPAGRERSPACTRRSTRSTRASTRGTCCTHGEAAGRCTPSVSTWSRRTRSARGGGTWTATCAAAGPSSPRADVRRLTRRELLGGAAAGALAAAGIYELVDQLAGSPNRAAAGPLRPEQHIFDAGTVHDNGVKVVVPPLHHQVVTAKLK